MSEVLWQTVASKTNEHSYMTKVERTVDRVRATGEVFTPTSLVIEMLKGCGIEMFEPGKTVLDPACGDGQFLVAVKWLKVVAHDMTEREALRDLFGIDIMRDNVDLCRLRLGGGTVIMGDALAPYESLAGQHPEEHRLMMDLFGGPADKSAKIRRLGRPSVDLAERPTLF